MTTAERVAEYFRMKAADGSSLTHLKLQKLVYYAQGYHLGHYGTPMFSEELEAWDHGPVVPDLYRAYKVHGNRQIPPASVNVRGLPASCVAVLDEVWEQMRGATATQLRSRTHAEDPWKNAYKNAWSHRISVDAMREYFAKRLHSIAPGRTSYVHTARDAKAILVAIQEGVPLSRRTTERVRALGRTMKSRGVYD